MYLEYEWLAMTIDFWHDAMIHDTIFFTNKILNYNDQNLFPMLLY